MISPSLMCADFMNLGDELRKLEKGDIEYLHIDIMDGVYVPNYTLGTDFVKPAAFAKNRSKHTAESPLTGSPQCVLYYFM